MTTRNTNKSIQVGSLFPQLDRERIECYRKFLADCYQRRQKISKPTVGLDEK